MLNDILNWLKRKFPNFPVPDFGPVEYEKVFRVSDFKREFVFYDTISWEQISTLPVYNALIVEEVKDV